MQQTTIAPWLTVNNSTRALEYFIAAFGAKIQYQLEDDGRIVLAQLAVDNADFWIQEDPAVNPEIIEQGNIRLILTVEDPDFVYQQAIVAGGKEVYLVTEEHGWRIGRLIDPFGYYWEVGKRIS